MKESLNIAIAGATGYIGVQLVRILSKHPKVKIIYLCANKSAGKYLKNFNKKNFSIKLPRITKIKNINMNKIDILFTALPNGEAQKISKIIPENVKLIDLSADFRLKNYKDYKKWYGINHKNKNLINKSLYSISEFVKNEIHKARIIACPGCYPTSIQIPLVPLIRRKMIQTDSIIVDSKSGFSGAGKNVKKKFKYKNLFNSVNAYGVGSHRHMV